MVPSKMCKNVFAIFGGNGLKCNSVSKLLNVFLGPLLIVIILPTNTYSALSYVNMEFLAVSHQGENVLKMKDHTFRKTLSSTVI
jgi:uncharacterized membrane protein